MYLLDHPLEAIRYYGERLGLAFRNRTLIVSQRTAGAKDARPKAQGDVDVRVVGRTDFDALRYPDPGGWLTLHEARTWLDRGYGRLIAAIQGEEIVAYCWLETGVVHLDFFDMDAALAAEDYYISKVYVAPKCRRGTMALTISKAMAVEAIRVAELEGRKCGWIAHVPEQTAMKHVFRSLGWQPLRTVVYKRVGPMSWFQCSSDSEESRVVLGGRKMAAMLFCSSAGTIRDR